MSAMADLPSFYAVIQYDGSRFSGWQRQKKERTVQREFEEALSRISAGPSRCVAAGRTDSGVHALGQVVSFRLAGDWATGNLARALNANLPPDIWVRAAGAAPQDFNARRQATSRRYRYLVGTDPSARSPFRRPFEWDLCRPLDGELLDMCAVRLLGEHDFRCLSARGQEKKHYRSIVTESRWERRDRNEGFIFHVRADRFLHHMVRFMVGLQVDIALGRRPMGDMEAVLAAADNSLASAPAPARGLYFVGATYTDLEQSEPT